MASSYFTTSLLPSGNRLVTDAFCPGLDATPRALQPVERTWMEETIGPNLGARWIVGTPSTEEDTDFWLVMDNGDQYALAGDNATEWLSADTADRPLILAQGGNSTAFVPLLQPASASSWSAAVPTPDGGYLLVEESMGYALTQLAPNSSVVTHESLTANVISPLPDSMISYSPDRQLWALYTRATSVYDHAVLGDPLEGGALTVLQWNPETQRVEFYGEATLEEQSDTVFEGLGPIWADVDGDGVDDLVTTVSNSAVGARLRVYSVTDKAVTMLAQAPAINRGGRWLHQLAVGPLGPNGETEIVEIRTPHIGGIVRYYQFEDNTLQLVASTSRYTSHDMRSRNLDRAVVGDFNGDGIPELVVQNQVKDVLVALQRTQTGIETIWSIPLSSPVESNLAVSCSADTMELLFSTQSHHLVKAQFVPTEIDTEVERGGIPPTDDGLEDQPLDAEEAEDSTPVIIASGGRQLWGRSSSPALLCLGLSMLLFVGAF